MLRSKIRYRLGHFSLDADARMEEEWEDASEKKLVKDLKKVKIVIDNDGDKGGWPFACTREGGGGCQNRQSKGKLPCLLR